MAPAALAEEGAVDETAPETGQDVDAGEEPAPLNPLPPGEGENPEVEVPPGDAPPVAGDGEGDGVADTEPEADAPVMTAALADFGSGKDFSIVVEPGNPAPEDLDLSGARFALTEVGADEAAGECVTAEDGSCSVVADTEAWESEDGTLGLPTGAYVITQTAASPGLEAHSGSVGVLHLCEFPNCSYALEPVAVPNASLFRTQVVTTAVDATDGDVLSGASYGLTGPDYPRVDPVDEQPDPEEPEFPFPGFPFPGFPFPGFPFPGLPVGAVEPAAAPAILSASPSTFVAGTETTGADGTATHAGWFLPGEGYALTPLGAPTGYVLDGDIEFEMQTSPAQAGSPWTMDHEWTPTGAGSGSGDGTGGAPGPRPRPVPAPAPAPAPVPGPAPAVAPAPGPVNQRPPAGGSDVDANAAPVTPATPSSSPSPAPSSPSGIPAELMPSGDGIAADSPELDTVASDLPDAGLVAAFGIGFLAVVLSGLALVRRHARRRG